MKKMLIISASQTITDILAKHFQKEYHVYTCSSGKDAIQQLQTITPDILIISLIPSDMAGLSVLQQSTYRPPVIIALTNYISNSILEKAQAVGIKALIRLPCTVSGIESHLNRLLNE